MAYKTYGYTPWTPPPTDPPATQQPKIDPRTLAQQLMQSLVKDPQGGGQFPSLTEVFGPTHNGD
jgi:hypothetical protein